MYYHFSTVAAARGRLGGGGGGAPLPLNGDTEDLILAPRQIE